MMRIYQIIESLNQSFDNNQTDVCEWLSNHIEGVDCVAKTLEKLVAGDTLTGAEMTELKAWDEQVFPLGPANAEQYECEAVEQLRQCLTGVAPHNREGQVEHRIDALRGKARVADLVNVMNRYQPGSGLTAPFKSAWVQADRMQVAKRMRRLLRESQGLRT
jgi:hypothetical protein